MKKHISFLMILFSCFCFAQDQAENYVGIGFQNDTYETWKIQLSRNSEDTFLVNYPELECSGIWKISKKNKKKFPKEKRTKHVIAQEEIVTGLDKCVNNGWVLLVDDQLSETTKRFYIFRTENDEKPYAFGFLELNF